MGKKEADFSDASRETMAVEDRQRYLDQRLIDINQYTYQNAPAVRNKMDRASLAVHCFQLCNSPHTSVG
ncbi:hypothetical protein ES703_105331 [subsurface metagenome]